jgi:hypothetical protein
MSSLHMLRPFSARQLSLVAGEGRVVAFAVLGGRRRGTSVDVHVPTLHRRMRDLEDSVEAVVFFDDPVPDGALVALIDDMVDAFMEGKCDILAVGAPATEAVKQVEGDAVAGEIDRSTLLTVRCPEVVSKSVLDAALRQVGDLVWGNPTEIAVAAGAKLQIFDPSVRTMVG